MDVSQMTDEALVDDCCVAFADAYDPSSGLLANVEAKVRWESHEAELLRRLAAAARPEQVTMTAREFVQWWYDGYPINHDPILIVADPDFYTKHLTPQQDGAE